MFALEQLIEELKDVCSGLPDRRKGACRGRARWKIENATFNVLKTNGYNLEHNFGHGKEILASDRSGQTRTAQGMDAGFLVAPDHRRTPACLLCARCRECQEIAIAQCRYHTD